MPKNNNQKVQSVAVRLTKLPMLRSACTKLSVLYADTKCSHPKLRSVCEGLESCVTAVVSSVTLKLEPQISIANDIACKSLDWLETTFPVVQAPTEQVVATAKKKMHEIQDVVRTAANGTVDCVQHGVTWLMGRLQQDDDGDDQANQPLVERAISVASMGLESALMVCEALVDRVLPPTDQDKEAAQLLVGFESATPRHPPVRLVSLATKLNGRIYLMVGGPRCGLFRCSESTVRQEWFDVLGKDGSIYLFNTAPLNMEVMENLSRSSGVVQYLQTSWQTLVWNIRELPRYMQHQLVSTLFFIVHIYNLGCSPSQHHQSTQNRSYLNAAEKSTHRVMVQGDPRAAPSACRMRRSTKTTAFDNRCNVKGCVCR